MAGPIRPTDGGLDGQPGRMRTPMNCRIIMFPGPTDSIRMPDANANFDYHEAFARNIGWVTEADIAGKSFRGNQKFALASAVYVNPSRQLQKPPVEDSPPAFKHACRRHLDRSIIGPRRPAAPSQSLARAPL